MLLRHIAVMLLASILAIFCIHPFGWLLHGFGWIYNIISSMLAQIIASGEIGTMLRRVIALMFIPVAGGVVISACYYTVRGRAMQDPYYFMWVLWTIMATLIALHFQS